MSAWPLVQVFTSGGDSGGTALGDCQARLQTQPDLRLHPGFTTYLPSGFGQVASLNSVSVSSSGKWKGSGRVFSKHLGQCLARGRYLIIKTHCYKNNTGLKAWNFSPNCLTKDEQITAPVFASMERRNSPCPASLLRTL